MALQQFEQFNFDNAVDWFMRMEASSGQSISMGQSIAQKTFLLANVGSKASTLLTDLLAPKDINDATKEYEYTYS